MLRLMGHGGVGNGSTGNNGMGNGDMGGGGGMGNGGVMPGIGGRSLAEGQPAFEGRRRRR